MNNRFINSIITKVQSFCRLNSEMNVLTSILRFLGVEYTEKYASNLYNEHPYRYNMLGLSMMLNAYGIENMGIRMNCKNEIMQLHPPFIAHFGNDFVTVYKIKNNNLHYIWKEKNISSDFDSFNASWTGLILLAKKTHQSIEPDYKTNVKRTIYQHWTQWLCMLLVATLVLYLYIDFDIYKNIASTCSLGINLVGLYIGYLLLLKQLHIQSKYADKICSVLKKGDCTNVLESPAARFLGVISWSEIGFSYFFSNILILLFIPSLLNYYVFVNLFTLPFSLWSVWYQRYRAKQWCTLCLCVQLLFWLIFVSNLGVGWMTFPDFRIKEMYLTSLIYLFPYLLLNIILPRIMAERQVTEIRQYLNSFKMQDEVFNALLRKQPYHEINKTTSQILFGNINSDIVLTVLTNPHCAPCAIMHKKIIALLNEVGDRICVQFVFSAFDDSLEMSNRFLIAVYQQKSIKEAENIFNEWYEGGKYDSENYIAQHPIDINSPDVFEESRKHHNWKDANGLSATPTLLLNGYEIPSLYRLEDMKYFTKLRFESNKTFAATS